MDCRPGLCTCGCRDVAEFTLEKLLHFQEISLISCVLSVDVEVCVYVAVLLNFLKKQVYISEII